MLLDKKHNILNKINKNKKYQSSHHLNTNDIPHDYSILKDVLFLVFRSSIQDKDVLTILRYHELINEIKKTGKS